MTAVLTCKCVHAYCGIARYYDDPGDVGNDG